MTPFEYVTVLISIILGLGITQIVTGVADIIHQWVRIKIYWPHLLWIILAFFLHIQEWWELYTLRDYNMWRLPIFMFTILYPINLFILARILFPSGPENPVIDLKIFYFNNYRKFFLLIIILAVLSILDDVFIGNRDPADQVIEFLLIITLSIVAIKKLNQEWIHRMIVILLLAFVVGYLVVEWNDLLLK